MSADIDRAVSESSAPPGERAGWVDGVLGRSTSQRLLGAAVAPVWTGSAFAGEGQMRAIQRRHANFFSALSVAHGAGPAVGGDADFVLRRTLHHAVRPPIETPGAPGLARRPLAPAVASGAAPAADAAPHAVEPAAVLARTVFAAPPTAVLVSLAESPQAPGQAPAPALLASPAAPSGSPSPIAAMRHAAPAMASGVVPHSSGVHAAAQRPAGPVSRSSPGALRPISAMILAPGARSVDASAVSSALSPISAPVSAPNSAPVLAKRAGVMPGPASVPMALPVLARQAAAAPVWWSGVVLARLRDQAAPSPVIDQGRMSLPAPATTPHAARTAEAVDERIAPAPHDGTTQTYRSGSAEAPVTAAASPLVFRTAGMPLARQVLAGPSVLGEGSSTVAHTAARAAPVAMPTGGIDRVAADLTASPGAADPAPPTVLARRAEGPTTTVATAGTAAMAIAAPGPVSIAASLLHPAASGQALEAARSTVLSQPLDMPLVARSVRPVARKTPATETDEAVSALPAAASLPPLQRSPFNPVAEAPSPSAAPAGTQVNARLSGATADATLPVSEPVMRQAQGEGPETEGPRQSLPALQRRAAGPFDAALTLAMAPAAPGFSTGTSLPSATPGTLATLAPQASIMRIAASASDPLRSRAGAVDTDSFEVHRQEARAQTVQTAQTAFMAPSESAASIGHRAAPLLACAIRRAVASGSPLPADAMAARREAPVHADRAAFAPADAPVLSAASSTASMQPSTLPLAMARAWPAEPAVDTSVPAVPVAGDGDAPAAFSATASATPGASPAMPLAPLARRLTAGALHAASNSLSLAAGLSSVTRSPAAGSPWPASVQAALRSATSLGGPAAPLHAMPLAEPAGTPAAGAHPAAAPVARHDPAGPVPMSAAPAIEVDELVERAWRALLDRLSIEQERRGQARWT